VKNKRIIIDHLFPSC
jgi:hypothetical protein